MNSQATLSAIAARRFDERTQADALPDRRYNIGDVTEHGKVIGYRIRNGAWRYTLRTDSTIIFDYLPVVD